MESTSVKELFQKKNAEAPIGSHKAADFNNELGFMLRNRPIYDKIGPLIGQSVLDLGCGNGGFLLCGLFNPAHYVGIDIVPEFVDQVSDILRRRRISGTAHVNSVLDVSPFLFESFDWVILNGVNSYTELFPTASHFMSWYQDALIHANGLAMTSMSKRAPKHFEGRLYLEPAPLLARASEYTDVVDYDHSYCDHDFLIVTRQRGAQC